MTISPELDSRLSLINQRMEAISAFAGAMLDVGKQLQDLSGHIIRLGDPTALHQATEAKLFALEAIIIEVFTPMMLMAAPAETLKIVRSMRKEVRIHARHPGSDLHKMIAEEHLADLADRIEKQLSDNG